MAGLAFNGKNRKKEEKEQGCAHGDDDGGTCKELSTWLDGRHHQHHAQRRGGRHDVPPQLEGRGIHM
jgi:hypothetical protein